MFDLYFNSKIGKKEIPFVFLYFILLLPFFFSCERETKEQRKEQILVRVGDKSISANEFIRRAEFTIRPTYCSEDNYIHRKIILNSLVAEKLLALEAGDKMGGHFVLGHVECEGKLKRAIKKAQFWQMEIEVLSKDIKFLVENGSVALDGISLTIKRVLGRSFTVDIIPFTYEHTTLKSKSAGSWLNIEFDYLLKQKK